MARIPSLGDHGDSDGEVWNAISVFEQILEAMPDDQASLEALSHAYEQVGDHTRAKEFEIRLARRLISQGDSKAAQALLERIRLYVAEDPSLNELVAEIEAMTAQAASVQAARSEKRLARADSRTQSGVAEELTLAWNLLQHGELSQEEYAGIVQDLTELSANSKGRTVSVLHVLQARGFKGIERIIVAISKEYNAPIISVLGFDLRDEVLRALPVDLMVRCGAMVFEFVGKDALVALMNPADIRLRKDLEEILARTCHFYMTLPSEFDTAMEKARSLKSE
jgi:hypothetical protein